MEYLILLSLCLSSFYSKIMAWGTNGMMASLRIIQDRQQAFRSFYQFSEQGNTVAIWGLLNK